MQMTQVELSVNVATTWLRSCSGCHIKMFDLQEEFFNLKRRGAKVNFFTTVDEKSIPQVDIGIIEGAVANTENERMLKRFRERAKILVAVGTCACFGEQLGIREMFKEEEDSLGQSVAQDRLSQTEGCYPQGRPLCQFVSVDYAVAGCPPLFKTLKEVIMSLAKGQKPKLKSNHNLCVECKRKKSALFAYPDLPNSLETFHKAIQNQRLDPAICFLDQGVLCKGKTTVEGCGARCLKENIPCWGCMGPVFELPHEGERENSDLSPPMSLDLGSLPEQKPADDYSFIPAHGPDLIQGAKGPFLDQ